MVVDIYNTNKKYNIIYADPPWSYKDKRKGKKISGGATNHYKTMNIRDIEKMGNIIEKISDKDCMLFMWATFPNLIEALKTLGFSWIKTNKKDGKPFFRNRFLYKKQL